MTDLETLQHEAIVGAVSFMAAGTAPAKARYLDVMDLLRRSIKRYENKQYGCATGFHAGRCSCVPAKLGCSDPV
jgi:hypothetical protein